MQRLKRELDPRKVRRTVAENLLQDDFIAALYLNDRPPGCSALIKSLLGDAGADNIAQALGFCFSISEIANLFER